MRHLLTSDGPLSHCRKTNNTTYCVYTHARTYIYMHIWTCMYMCINICINICMCTHVLKKFIFIPFAHVVALCPAANRFITQPSTYIYAYTCIINASLAHIRWLVVPLQKMVTGWRRCRECLISMRHFPQQNPIIHGSFAERDLHLKAFSAFSPSCETTCCVHTYKCVYIYGKFVLYSLLAYNWHMHMFCLRVSDGFLIPLQKNEGHHLMCRYIICIHIYACIYMCIYNSIWMYYTFVNALLERIWWLLVPLQRDA